MTALTDDRSPSTPAIRLITGLLHPELERRLFHEVHSLKAADPLVGIVVLVGSRAPAAYLEWRAARAGVNLFNVRFVTLAQLGRDLQGADPADRPELPAGGEVALTLAGLPSAAGEGPFGSVAGFPGFARALARSFADLDEAGIGELDPLWLTGERGEAGLRGAELARMRLAYLSRLARFRTGLDLLDAPHDSGNVLRQIYGADALLVYGLYDFNAVQLKFLEALASSIPTLFLIPHAEKEQPPLAPRSIEGGDAEKGVVRPAYQFAERIGDRLRRRFGVTPERSQAVAAALSTQLFDYSSKAPRSPVSSPEIKVIRAADPAAEAAAIAGTITELVFEEGVSPADIGVILWRAQKDRPLLMEALRDAGIPFSDGFGTSLSETPEGRVLLALTSLSPNRIKRRELIDIMHSAGIVLPRLEGEDAVAQMETVSVACGIIQGGADAWDSGVAGYLRRTAEEGVEAPRPAAAALLRDFVRRLLARLQALDKAQTAAALSEATRALAAEFLPPGEVTETLLGQIAALANLGEADIELDRIRFRWVLQAALDAVVVRRGKPVEDGVWLLSSKTARGVSFDFLFLPGLTLGGAPVAPREDPLLPDDVRRRINRRLSGDETTPLPLQGTRSEEERLLFALAVDSARRRLTLSYPMRGLGDGSPQLPSRYLLDLCRVVSGRSVDSEQLDRLDFFTDVALGDGAPGWENRLLKPVDYPLEWALRLPATERAAAARSVFAGRPSFDRLVRLARSRSTGEAWTEFDGMVGGPLGVGSDSSPQLAGGSEGGCSSQEPLAVTSLESWAGCPYRSFIERRLRLKRWEEPEISLDPGSQAVGQVVHRALDQLYSEASAPRRLPFAGANLIWAVERVPEIVNEMHSWLRAKWPAPEAIWTATERALKARLAAAVESLSALDEDYVFSRSEEELAGSLSVSTPDISGGRVYLTGQADRLDRTPDRAGVRLIDYKTGKTSKTGSIEGGTALQLPLYLRLLFDRDEATLPARSSAAYYQIDLTGKVSARVLEGAWVVENADLLERAVETIACGIGAGNFPPLPGKGVKCDYCPVRMACDISSRRAAGRRSGDLRMAGLAALREET